MSHEHNKHDHCAHTELAYCAHCDVAYCKACGHEWGKVQVEYIRIKEYIDHWYPHWTYLGGTTYRTTTGDSINLKSIITTALGTDNQSARGVTFADDAGLTGDHQH